MGGPGAGVLLRETLTKRQEDELEIWLRSITNHLEKEKAVYKFWLNEDSFPGTVSRCLFYLSVEDTQKHWGEDEKKQIKELLGYLPEQSIGVASGCHQDEDHSTLGQFVLHLAKVYSGLIDMEGAITPPLKPPSTRRPSLEEISAYVRAMPGSIYEIEYTAAAGHRWVSHMVDVPFFQAWMEHPNFHMIK